MIRCLCHRHALHRLKTQIFHMRVHCVWVHLHCLSVQTTYVLIWISNSNCIQKTVVSMDINSFQILTFSIFFLISNYFAFIWSKGVMTIYFNMWHTVKFSLFCFVILFPPWNPSVPVHVRTDSSSSLFWLLDIQIPLMWTVMSHLHLDTNNTLLFLNRAILICYTFIYQRNCT